VDSGFMHSDEERLSLATLIDELPPPECWECLVFTGSFSGAPDLASGFFC